jgi:hypothetical protein
VREDRIRWKNFIKKKAFVKTTHLCVGKKNGADPHFQTKQLYVSAIRNILYNVNRLIASTLLGI